MSAPKQAIANAGRKLAPALFAPFRTLVRDLESYRGRWGLFLLRFAHRDEQVQVSRALAWYFGEVTVLDVADYADWLALEQALSEAAKHSVCIELPGLDEWLDSYPDPAQASARLRAWNIRREGYASSVSVPVLCWLRSERMRALADIAPDLWSWRAGVYEFVLQQEAEAVAALPAMPAVLGPFDNRNKAERQQRIGEIEQYLAQAENLHSPLQISLLFELAGLLHSQGEYAGALQVLQQRLLALCGKLGDEHSLATTHGRIADILQARGELDQALALRREQQIPVYEKLGDERALAVAQGKIADILQARGELDQALALRREQEIPVYEKLGDVRSLAITQGKIADILEARGELDQALALRREQEIPVYEKLGDVRELAITQGKIADTLQARGELDQALAIRREQEIPVYEKLGDVRNLALTQGQIADILEARGELDQALALRREQAIPVFEKLGDVRGLLVARANQAITLLARAQPGDVAEARQLLLLALDAAEHMRLPEVALIQDWLKECEPA